MTRTLTLAETGGKFAMVADSDPARAPAPLMPSFFTTALYGVDVTNDAATVRYNSDGLPTLRLPGLGIFHLNPTTIAQWGIAHYNVGHYDRARQAADWLLSIQREDGGFPLMFDYVVANRWNMQAPWVSALTQGNAISLLARLYVYCRFERYREAAIAALGPLDTSIAEGGVQGTFVGGPWFEEIPDPQWPSHIFNGSLFALIGIGDAAEVLGDPIAQALWTTGEATLRAALSLNYPDGFFVWGAALHPDRAQVDESYAKIRTPWMVYELAVNGVPAVPHYVKANYMRCHIALLQEFHLRTGHGTYSGCAAAISTAFAGYLADGGN